MCVPVIREGAEGEEGDEAVVSGWIAVLVEAAAVRRRMERRIDVGELDRVAGVAKVVVGAKNALYVNARGCKMGRGLGPLLAGTGQRAGQGTGPGGRHQVGVWCTPAASRGREGVLAGWALGLAVGGCCSCG